ncbi:MAG: hypothetical protein NTV86_10575 [Planctomycetota bacterium]|nr:hypothetical protein [Planctomycetota bacterium]
MSSLTEQQYERIARYLDGEPVSLTPAEAAFARRLRQTEDALARALPVPFEPGLIERVWRRVSRRTRAARRHVRFAFSGAAAAAAVAVVFLGVRWFTPVAAPRGGGVVASVPPVQRAGRPVERVERFVPRLRPSLRRPERIVQRDEPPAPRVEPAAPRVDVTYAAADDRVLAIGRELDRDLYSLETNAVFSRTPSNPLDLTESADDTSDTRSAPAADPTRG